MQFEDLMTVPLCWLQMIISSLLGTVWVATGAPTPTAATTFLKMLGDLVFGAAAFTIGMFLQTSVHHHNGRILIISKMRAIGVIALRHILAPAIALLVVGWYPLRPTADHSFSDLKAIFVMTTALPLALTSFNVALEYSVFPEEILTGVTAGTLLALPVLLGWLGVMQGMF